MAVSKNVRPSPTDPRSLALTSAAQTCPRLGYKKRLRIAFPEFEEVRIVREGAHRLRGFCVTVPGSEEVSTDRLDDWGRKHQMAHLELVLEQVPQLPDDLDDEDTLLRRTNVKRIVAEELPTSTGGLLRCLEIELRGDVTNLINSSRGLIIHVADNLPKEREQRILDTVRLLLTCDPLSMQLKRSKTHSRGPHSDAESNSTYRQLADDTNLLHSYLPGVLQNEPAPLHDLPGGAATYASAGAPFEEFLDALPTGRLVPVPQCVP